MIHHEYDTGHEIIVIDGVKFRGRSGQYDINGKRLDGDDMRDFTSEDLENAMKGRYRVDPLKQMVKNYQQRIDEETTRKQEADMQIKRDYGDIVKHVLNSNGFACRLEWSYDMGGAFLRITYYPVTDTPISDEAKGMMISDLYNMIPKIQGLEYRIFEIATHEWPSLDTVRKSLDDGIKAARARYEKKPAPFIYRK